MAPSTTSITPNFGSISGGTPVTIIGTGFAAGLIVKLGGTPVTDLIVDSSTQVRGTTAAHALGTVDVEVSFLEAHAVVGLAAVAAESAVDLTWSAPDNAADAGVTGYHIVVSPGGATVDVAGLSTTVSGLTDGTLYTFTVYASNGGGALGIAASTTATPVDTTAPVVTTFTIGTPTGLVVPITAFTSSDNMAVTRWKVTTSSTPPSWASMAGSAPTDWTAGADGAYDLYPWVGDDAGNVSAVFGSPRSVTIDTTAPVVTAFTLGTPTALVVPITSLTASGSPSGYAVTETNVAPSLGSFGSAPTDHTFSGAGTYNLYAWACDSAGNISASLSAGPVTVTGADVTAPDSPVITVPARAHSTTVTSISVTGHDAVGVTDYCIKNVAHGASAPTFSSGDTWTACTPATSLSLSGLSATAGATGWRDFYVALRDAAGNISAASAASSTTVGLLIPIDANEVAHFYVSGAALVDRVGNSWAMQGSGPTMNGASTVFGTSVESMGPFSDSNYYNLGTGSDVLDFTGDFTVTFVLAGNPSDGVAFTNYGSGNGYFVEYFNSVGEGYNFTAYSGGSGVRHPAGLVGNGSDPHVFSFGRAGSTYYMKLDGNAVTSGAASIGAGTAAVATLGRFSSATGYAWASKIWEARFTTTAPSSAALDALHTAVTT